MTARGDTDDLGAAATDCEISTDVAASEWDAYVAAHRDGTIDHCWRWRHVLERGLGHQAVYLAARRDGRIVGVLPLVRVRSWVFGRSVVSVPFLNYGGVLADDRGVVDQLVDDARRVAIGFGASHLELRHTTRQCPDLPCRRHKLAMTRSLPGTAEALWESLDRKVRNQVRKARKEGLAVEVGGAGLLGEFYAVFARNMRDLGTPVYSRQLFVQTLAAFPEAARVFVVRKGVQPVAAGISLRFRDTALNPWASSLREFRPLAPNMLLYWAMLEQAVADRMSIFDFGRSSPGAGTHQFKLQWGATEQPLCWEYVLMKRTAPPDQGPSSDRFALAVDIWKRLPMPVASVFGPMVARHLP